MGHDALAMAFAVTAPVNPYSIGARHYHQPRGTFVQSVLPPIQQFNPDIPKTVNELPNIQSRASPFHKFSGVRVKRW